MKNKLMLSKIITMGILSYIFIGIWLSLFGIVDKVFPLLNIFDVVSILGIYLLIAGFCLFLVFISRNIRINLLIISAIISGIVFVFLVIATPYNPLEAFLLIFCGLIPIISIILIKIMNLRNQITKIAIISINIVLLVIFCIIMIDKLFFWTIIQSLIIFVLSCISLKYSLKYYTHRLEFNFELNKYIKWSLILIPIIMAMITIFPVKVIEIDPNNAGDTDIIFWTGARQLPDNDTLEYCGQNNIGFVLAFRCRYVDDGGVRELHTIQRALDRNVDIYLNIAGETTFFVNIESAKGYPETYLKIRNWMISNNIFDHPNFKGFFIDAESPLSLIEDMSDFSFIGKFNHFIQGIPTDKEMKQAEEDLSEMISLIHEDGKTIGIIKMPSQYDDLDGDGDLSRLIKNIYYLDLNFDTTITMLYRGQHFANVFDFMIDIVDSQNYLTLYESEFSQLDQLERNLITLNQFYYKAVYEMNCLENRVSYSNRYLFIGVYTRKFRDTSYIQNREYLKDFDIARSLGCNKVFIYLWTGWRSLYGSSELQRFVEHRDNAETWLLYVPSYLFIREILFSLGMASFDRFLFI